MIRFGNGRLGGLFMIKRIVFYCLLASSLYSEDFIDTENLHFFQIGNKEEEIENKFLRGENFGPTAIYIDQKNNLYIANELSENIKVYDNSYSFMYSIPCSSRNKSYYNRIVVNDDNSYYLRYDGISVFKYNKVGDQIWGIVSPKRVFGDFIIIENRLVMGQTRHGFIGFIDPKVNFDNEISSPSSIDKIQSVLSEMNTRYTISDGNINSTNNFRSTTSVPQRSSDKYIYKDGKKVEFGYRLNEQDEIRKLNSDLRSKNYDNFDKERFIKRIQRGDYTFYLGNDISNNKIYIMTLKTGNVVFRISENSDLVDYDFFAYNDLRVSNYVLSPDGYIHYLELTEDFNQIKLIRLLKKFN